MRTRALRLVAVAFLSVSPGFAAVQPSGADYQVNTRSDFMQVNPAAAFAPSGAPLVVWENDQRGLRARWQGQEIDLVTNRLLATGASEGTVVNRREPTVAFLASGQFLVAWTEETAFLRVVPFLETREILSQEIFVQRFAANAQPVGAAQRLSDATGSFHSAPRLALGVSGAGVVVWQEGAAADGPGPIAARRVDDRGRPSGLRWSVSKDVTALHPVVAVGADGGAVIAWDAQKGGAEDVFARAYDAEGAPLGGGFRVNTATAGRQRWPSIAAAPEGGMLVAWQGYASDRSKARILGQVLRDSGARVGGEVAVALDEGTAQLAPALGPLPGGRWLATWLTWSDLGLGVRGVELAGDGTPATAEFWVKTGVVVKTYHRSLAVSATGQALALWEQVSRGGRRNIGARLLAD